MSTTVSAGLRAAVEALLFASGEPLSPERIAGVLGATVQEVGLALDELAAGCEREERGIHLARVSGGYQLRSKPEYAEYIERLGLPAPPSLSKAALETLAIIAYKQPISKAEIEWIRGVRADAALSTLIDRGLVKEAGRRDGPGRPILYKTTPEFLSAFGLNDLSDLPPAGDLAFPSR